MSSDVYPEVIQCFPLAIFTWGDLMDALNQIMRQEGINVSCVNTWVCSLSFLYLSVHQLLCHSL